VRRCPTCERGFLDEEVLCPLDGANLDLTAGALPADVGRVLGSYRLIGLVGAGAMGRVFVGRHMRLKRLAAIKWLKPELSERRDEVARFFDEARVVNEIRHPNIIDVFDLVEDVFAGSYYVMELLAGRELQEEMAQGPMPADRVIRIGAQIAQALHAVHERGIVHRDLKPENVILLDRGGPPGSYDCPKLVDFGVAKMADEEAEGVPFGTARYMAPEQAGPGVIDGRADLYSLGVLLYEMATGEHPFPSKNDNEYLMRHADEAPIPPNRRMPSGRRLPRDLEHLILSCLAKKPGGRPESGAALATALRAVDLDRVDRPRRRWVALLAAAALGIGGYLLWTTTLAGRLAQTRADPAPAVEASVVPAPAVATPAPAPPEKVTLEFRSEPPGASVYREGETVPIGMTPFEESFLKSNGTMRFRFTMAGRRDVEQIVSMAEGGAVAATMVEVAAESQAERDRTRTRPRTRARDEEAVKQPEAQPAKARDREGVMDPFAR
jgi:tRNA A-37 threonylcarbamoyl transferase component Bud32